MWCPDCGGEYRQGIEICPTCEVALTEHLEPARGRGGYGGPHGGHPAGDHEPGPRLAAPMADLVGYQDESHARDARKRLKAAKLHSELVIRDAEGTAPGDEPADEYWIRVPVRVAREAAEILDIDESLDEDGCPSCGGPLGTDGICRPCASRHGV